MRIVATALALVLLAGCANKACREALGTLERDRIVLKATGNEIILDRPVPEGSRWPPALCWCNWMTDASRHWWRAHGQRWHRLKPGSKNCAMARDPRTSPGASARVSGARAAVIEAQANLSAGKTTVTAETRGPGHAGPGPGQSRLGGGIPQVCTGRITAPDQWHSQGTAGPGGGSDTGRNSAAGTGTAQLDGSQYCSHP